MGANDTCIRALGLRERTGSRLVRHARRKPLVERPRVPLDLLVHVLNVLVRQDDGRERRRRRIRDEPVDTIRKVRVGTPKHVWKVPARMPLVALQVDLDVPCSRAKDVLVVLDCGIPVPIAPRVRVRATPDAARVAPARHIVVRVQ